MSTSAVLCPFFVRCGCNKAVDLFCWHSSSSASWFDYVLDGMCIWWFSSGESLTCWWNCFTNLNWQIFEDEANLLRLFLLKFVIYSLLLRYKCQSLSNSLSLTHIHTYIHYTYIIICFNLTCTILLSFCIKMEMLDLPQQSTYRWHCIREAADGCGFYSYYYYYYYYYFPPNTQPLIFDMASV